jgi:hypothetical protein
MTRKAGFRFVLAATVLALAAAPAALAGKGGGKGGGATAGGTLTLVVLDGADSLANHLERVTFKVSTTATDRPFVGLRCWQGANWILDAYVGVFPDYMFDPWITLHSDYWTDGITATCTARLFYPDRRGNEVVLATLGFQAGP